MEDFLFSNPISFAICTSTFQQVVQKIFAVACRRVLTSTPDDEEEACVFDILDGETDFYFVISRNEE
jgi:hypothetical protein